MSETLTLFLLTSDLLWCSSSVLWLDVMSVAGGQRLSAFGCQNGCVGLALVSQARPGEAPGDLRTGQTCQLDCRQSQLVIMSVMLHVQQRYSSSTHASIFYPCVQWASDMFHQAELLSVTMQMCNWVLVSVRRLSGLLVISLSWKSWVHPA